MASRIPATLAIALCYVLAGCSGFVSTGTPTETVTPESTPERPDGSAIEYSALSAAQQQAFDRVLESGSVEFGPDSPALDYDFQTNVVDPFHDHDYVKRNGTYYDVTLTPRGFVASYNIQTETVAVDDNETAVPFENVTGEHTEYLRMALENGSHYLPPGTTSYLNISLGFGERVEYQGTTYRVQIAVGDLPTYELTAEKVD